ncbi:MULTISPECIES: hypothetical protein [unclassified Paraburkholderia]|uniref:hypothetical protein n=1 Tax=unclassified Paraburkholderia TaxID=2615204 RepID=UPI00161E9CD5|nr:MULTISPECIES: hypothetical protein [unclassified Paraburkholderia]MBB5443267.1 hypothetical protein [Paraburkholderia sp. WSM4177]MBB5483127.1 hypothetical protein [Paraburkholderia sp. WSM4180]
MQHTRPSAPLARVTGLGDYLLDVELEDSTRETQDILARAELVNRIAQEKFDAKIANLQPIDVIAAMQSFDMLEGEVVCAAFLESGSALRTLIAGRFFELLARECFDEAEKAVQMIERDDVHEDLKQPHRIFVIAGVQ